MVERNWFFIWYYILAFQHTISQNMDEYFWEKKKLFKQHLHACIWFYNFRIKSFEFGKQGLTFEIPRVLCLSDCAIRVLDPKYDHYSPTCKSYYPRRKIVQGNNKYELLYIHSSYKCRETKAHSKEFLFFKGKWIVRNKLIWKYLRSKVYLTLI